MSRFQFHSNRVRPLAWLPNTAGYRFVGVKNDGKTVKCRVVRDADTGQHSVKGVDEDVNYADLRGWKE